MSEKAKAEMSRMIQERLQSGEWNRRMADAVLARVEQEARGDELQARRRKTGLRAALTAAAAILLVAITSYGVYDFTRPADADNLSLSFLVEDEPGDDSLDGVFDSAALFDID